MGQFTRNQVPITAQMELDISIGNMEQQKRFERLLEHLTKQKTKFLKGFICGKELFDSLSQKAFAGEL